MELGRSLVQLPRGCDEAHLIDAAHSASCSNPTILPKAAIMNATSFLRSSKTILALAITFPFASLVAHADTDVVQAPIAMQPAYAPLTRAQVQADTAIWIAAGMDKYSREGSDEDLYSPQYASDMAVYSALRSSPQFAAIVRDYQSGQSVRLHVTRDPLRVSIATR